jgi:hypothetical protein
MVTMARAKYLTNCAIKLGEMVRVDPISCPPLGEPSRSPSRPVQNLTGAPPRVNAVVDLGLRRNRSWRAYLQVVSDTVE